MANHRNDFLIDAKRLAAALVLTLAPAIPGHAAVSGSEETQVQPTPSEQKSINEAMERLDTLYRSHTSRGKMRVQIANKRYSRTLEMDIVTLGLDYSRITITSPPKEKGIVTLKRKNEIWNHLPRINRSIRLPPSMMSESWMGSDLTNDDLIREVSWKDDYTHRRIDPSQMTLEPSISKDVDCFESAPRPDVPVTWSRVVTCMQSESGLPHVQIFYDEKDRLARRMVFTEVKALGGRRLPTQIAVLPQLADTKGQSTVVTYLEMNFDAPVDEREFQVSRLGD
jgi:hypothetical protein